MGALRVLVVDEDRATRELLRAFLTRAEFGVCTSGSAGEAIEAFHQQRSDVVLLDAGMEGTDGATMLQQMRTLAGDRWVPMVHLSAATDDETPDCAARAGADWALVKPCSYAVLEARLDGIRDILALRRELDKKNRALDRFEERARQELQLARRALRSFNRIEPECLRFLRHWIVPAIGFSGDTISAARAPDGAVWVMLADNSGHGLAAALNAIPMTRAFQAMATKGLKPEFLVAELNCIVRLQFERESRVVATIARISGRDGVMEVWNGGNPGALLVDGGGAVVRVFRSRHPPLGALTAAQFDARLETNRIASNLQLVIVSDGLLQIGGERPFGEPGLVCALAGAPPAKRFGSVVSRLQEIMSGHANRDDVSLALVDCDAIMDHCERTPVVAQEPG